MAEWWSAAYFFDLSAFEHRPLLEGVERVWEALRDLPRYIDEHVQPTLAGTIMPGAYVGERVQLGEGCVVEPGAMVKGPAIIGPGTVIRQGAYVREYVLIGAGCVVGHCTEVKGSILLDGAQAPHFNYVGDSILGRHCNLGAGTKLSNLKNDGTEVTVRGPEGQLVRTGLRKLGAIVGDGVATGCNAVTSPGALIGPGASIYANAVVRGFVPAGHVLKLRQSQELVPRASA
ncbi:MAG: glucose-1-phosphate thymidylyltransferase [Firmicutes bacterium]|nr:glucose-1-phosphate thymidylyltransferase [Bacillota bacterium]